MISKKKKKCEITHDFTPLKQPMPNLPKRPPLQNMQSWEKLHT